MHRENQEHLGGPSTDAPQLDQLCDNCGVTEVRQLVFEVERPSVDRVCQALDRLGLCSRRLRSVQPFVTAAEHDLGGRLGGEVVGDFGGHGVKGLHRDLLGDHRTH